MKKLIKATLVMGYEGYKNPMTLQDSNLPRNGTVEIPLTIICDFDNFKIDPKNRIQDIFLKDITRRIQTSLCLSSSDVNELLVKSIELKITD